MPISVLAILEELPGEVEQISLECERILEQLDVEILDYDYGEILQ